jgi:hypothetical protein
MRIFLMDAIDLYKKIVKKYWNEDLKNINFKFVQVELPYELYPASVDDIANNLYANGTTFRKYNTQSATIYLDSPNVGILFSVRA